MNPIDNADAYDYLIVRRLRSPGRWKWTTPPKRDNGWEKKEGKGADGGELICNGKRLVECAGELLLWRDERRDCYAEWEAWKSVLEGSTKDGPDQQALDVYHPMLAELKLSAFVLKFDPVLIPEDGGLSRVPLEFIQWAPKKKRTGTGKPKGAAAAPPPKEVDPRIAKATAKIETNDLELKRLDQ